MRSLSHSLLVSLITVVIFLGAEATSAGQTDTEKIRLAMQHDPENYQALDDGLMRALISDQQKKYTDVIKILDGVLFLQRFDNPKAETQIRDTSIIDTFARVELYRSLMYLLLGRSYYNSGNIPRSAQYYAAISENSPFYPLAKTEESWVKLSAPVVDDSLPRALEIGGGSYMNGEKELLKTLALARLGRWREASELIRTTHAIADHNLKSLVRDVHIFADARTMLQDEKGSPHESLYLKDLLEFYCLDATPPIAQTIRNFGVYFYLRSVRLDKSGTLSPKECLSKMSEEPGRVLNLRASDLKRLSDYDLLSTAELARFQQQPHKQVQLLSELINNYPSSIHASEARLKLADNYERQGNYRQAIPYYLEASHHKNPLKALYALYKLGINQLHLNEHDHALRSFSQVLMFNPPQGSTQAMNTKAGVIKDRSREIFIATLAAHYPFPTSYEAAVKIEFLRQKIADVVVSLAVQYSLRSDQSSAQQAISFLTKNFNPSTNALDSYLQSMKAHVHDELAEDLLLQILIDIKDYQRASDYLAEFITKEGLTSGQIRRCTVLTNNLAKNAAWAQLYHFALPIIREREGARFAKVVQSAAYQVALASSIAYKPGQNGKHSIDSDAQVWFRNAIAVNADPELTLQSWLELLKISVHNEDAPEKFEELYQEFDRRSQSFPATNSATRALYLKIHEMAAQRFESLERDYDKGSALIRAAEYTENGVERQKLRWETLRILESYQDQKKVAELISALRQSSATADNDKQILMCRALLLTGDDNGCWSILRKIIPTLAKEHSSGWLLLHDLYFKSKSHGRDPYNDMRKFIDHEGKALWSIPYLQSVISDIELQKTTSDFGRAVDDFNREVAAKKEQSKELVAGKGAVWERLLAIEFELRTLLGLKKLTVGFIESPIIPIQTLGMCRAYEQNSVAIDALLKTKNPVINTVHWNTLVTKVDQKVAELTTVAQKEKERCDKLTRLTFFVRQWEQSRITSEQTSANSPASVLMKLEQEFRNKRTPLKERLYGYAEIGALSRMRYVADSQPGKDNANFYQGFTRFVHGDFWNANAYFEKVGPGESTYPQSQLYLSYMLYDSNKGAPDKTVFASISRDKLNPYEAKWYDKIVLPQNNKASN